jgi:hypothetical protein
MHVKGLYKLTYHVSGGLHWWGLTRITEENNFWGHLRLLSVLRFMTAQIAHGKEGNKINQMSGIEWKLMPLESQRAIVIV